jgi:hypothetical protein
MYLWVIDYINYHGLEVAQIGIVEIIQNISMLWIFLGGKFHALKGYVKKKR